MTKAEALALINGYKNGLRCDLPYILQWTWLRAIILMIPDEDWERYLQQAVEDVLSR